MHVPAAKALFYVTMHKVYFLEIPKRLLQMLLRQHDVTLTSYCLAITDVKNGSIPFQSQDVVVRRKIAAFDFSLELNFLKSQLVGSRPGGYLQSMEKLISGPPKTNPSSGRGENVNPGSQNYKSITLNTKLRWPAQSLYTTEWNKLIRLNNSICAQKFKTVQ